MDRVIGRNRKKILDEAEDYADEVIRRSKHVFPHAARLCLISTFMEDGIRMWVQWNDQRSYIASLWNCGWFLSSMFVLYNLIVQLTGCVMVLGRIRVPIACGLLFSTIFLQTIGYGIFEDSVLVTRNLALSGALLLLVAESQVENRSLFAGLPSLGENTQKQYLQLGGRILLVLMFITLFRFEASLLQMLIIVGGLGLVLLVAIGYKTKLCALVLVFLLTLINFYYNAFWNIPSHQVSRDFAKYDFFQTFSVIGGLLLVVAIGPGGVSLDEHKKKW